MQGAHCSVSMGRPTDRRPDSVTLRTSASRPCRVGREAFEEMVLGVYRRRVEVSCWAGGLCAEAALGLGSAAYGMGL